MIRIDAMWLATEPIDMRAGAERLLARVVQVFGAAQAHHGYLFANAYFDLNNTWHYGATVNVASSSNYMRDYRIPGYGNDVLASTAFIEGFGVGARLQLHIRVEILSVPVVFETIEAAVVAANEGGIGDQDVEC